MFPPNGPGVVAEIASLRAGATPTQPSIGLSGSSSTCGLRSGESIRATPFALSIFQIRRFGSRSTRAAIDAGSTAYGASRLPEYAVARFGSIFSNVPTSMSSGSAPSM